MSDTHAAYMGDAVYAKLDELGRIVLTTDSHINADAQNVIVLESEVWRALVRWQEKLPK